MGRTNSFENEIALLLFNNTAIADIGDASGLQPSAVDGLFYIALYSVMPTDSTNGTEATYTGYARVSVARSVVGWTISGTDPTRAENASDIVFPTSSTSETILGASICFTISGVPKYYGTFTTAFSVINGYTPTISATDFKISFN